MIRTGFLSALLAAFALISGCTGSSRQSTSNNAAANLASATQPTSGAKPVVGSRPLIDFARGAGGFPLAHDSLPDSRDGLTAALTNEYRARVELPAEASPVLAVGSAYPNLETLAVDLSDGQIKSAYRPTALNALGR